MQRKLILEGFNYTKNIPIATNALELDNYWKTEGFNQETDFEKLLIVENGKEAEIDLNRWESEVWDRLFEYCSECELSHIAILKEFRNKGYSGARSLDHVEEEYFAIISFSKDLTNIEEEDALFEYLEEIGEFKDIPEKYIGYLDRAKILRDWQINVMPVIEIEDNVFAILFRKKDI